MSIADDILEGMFCQVCGEIMIEEDEEPCGYPVTCACCEEETKE